MMKRFLGWFLAGMLALLSCTALAESQATLVTLTDTAGAPLCHGIVVLDGQAVLAPLSAREAAAAQAEHAAAIGGLLAEDGHALLLSLDEPTGWTGAELSAEPLTSFQTVTVAGADAAPHQAQLLAKGILAQGTGFLLQDAQAQPGDVLLDASGAVQGLVTAPWQGMTGLWQVADAGALNVLLTRPAVSATPGAGRFLPGIQLTGHGDGTVDICWDEDLGSTMPAGFSFYVRCRNIDSPFYREAVAAPGQSSLRMTMQPGSTLLACVWAGTDADSPLTFPEDEALTAQLTLTPARPFNKYSYRQEMAIRLGDAQQALEAAALNRGDVPSLELNLRYRVKRDTVCPILLSCTTPDGIVLELDGTLTLHRDVSEAQTFIDLAALLELHQQLRPEWLPGEYTLRMYLEGALSGELAFQVK